MDRPIRKRTLGYNAVFAPATEGGFVVTFPDFPGCVTEGDTLDEAKAHAAEVLELWIEELAASNEEIPEHPGRPIVEEVEVEVTA
jgi:predicted RNase H-like HicB family nuclease